MTLTNIYHEKQIYCFKVLYAIVVLLRHMNNPCIGCSKREMRALLAFKQGLVDDDNRLLSWGREVQNKDCCQWDGVYCNNHTGHVVKLDLGGQSLQGTTSPKLVELQDLEYLNLSLNNFRRSQIPDFIGSLSNLRYLDLSYAEFGGEIPYQLGNLTHLQYLNLRNFNIHAKNLNWLSNLSCLKHIDLSFTNISDVVGWLEAVNMLPKLRNLILPMCNLPPPVISSVSLLNSSKSLVRVDLFYNNLNSSIFQWLSGTHTNLVDLDLSNNNLSGSSIPDNFGNMSSLAYLYLFLSRLKGGIPNSFAKLCRLRELGLRGNSLSGQFSDFIDIFSKCAQNTLELLDISQNHGIMGSVPDLTNFLSLKHLNLGGNKLNGRIPENIGQMSKLETIRFDWNSLEGVISETHLSKLFKLRDLHLSFNSLVWLDNDREIRASFDDYYQNLFSTSGPRNWGNIFDCIRPSVTRDMNLALCKPISDEEVKTAVLQLGSLKAPGPDGFPGMFYQKYWEHVNGVVNDAATSMGLWGEEMWKINATHIALIPKVPCPENATQFRPISLCNNSYKILAKILANWLKQILPHIISHHQNAFVPDRQVHDNLIVAHEAFHYLKLKKKGNVFEMGLKLDMNKAYDRVEWDFLEEAMVMIGFDRAWINLIMSCVTTVSFSVMVNGKPGRFFKPRRGLRQGDPLSPYLFIVVSEILSLNLSYAIDMGVLQGIKLCRGGPTLSHIFFANDSLFFLKANKGNCRALNRLLEGYCLASGQRINFEKSVIFMSPNTPLEVRNEVSAILKVPLSINPGNYLGLPTMWGRSKKLALQYVLERILKKIQRWKAKALTMAGREVLIKAVAMAVPTYPMSCFKFPSTMCKAINSEISPLVGSN